MTISHVFSLAREQFEIVNAVVGLVAVLVVYDLGRFEVAAQVLLHDVTVFEDVGKAGLFGIRRMRMAGRRCGRACWVSFFSHSICCRR